jgi:hypothetical protein
MLAQKASESTPDEGVTRLNACGLTATHRLCCMTTTSVGVKLHALHKSVVPIGVIVLLDLCNPPREVVVSWPNLGCCIPLCGFLAVIQLVRNRGREAE